MAKKYKLYCDEHLKNLKRHPETTKKDKRYHETKARTIGNLKQAINSLEEDKFVGMIHISQETTESIIGFHTVLGSDKVVLNALMNIFERHPKIGELFFMMMRAMGREESEYLKHGFPPIPKRDKGVG